MRRTGAGERVRDGAAARAAADDDDVEVLGHDCGRSFAQRERKQRVARGDEHVLPAVDHVRLRRIGDVADARVPEDAAILRVVGDEVAADVAGEDETAGGAQHAVAAEPVIGGIGVPPCDLSGPVVDGGQVVAVRAERRLRKAAETHGTARIGFGEIEHRVVRGDWHVEQPGLRD